MSNENAIATTNINHIMEQVLIDGDLKQLSSKDRLTYYKTVCESLGINPLTKPFEYIVLNGKLTLYALKNAAEQLAHKHKLSLAIQGKDSHEGIYTVTVRTLDPQGRFVDASGAVATGHLKGQALANDEMKAETKAMRRAILRHVGLGWLDETEVETIAGAQLVEVDHETGEIGETRPVRPISPAQAPRTEGTPVGVWGEGTPSAAPTEKGEWCEVHNTNFFKTPRMRSYGHPVDGGPFCNQPKETTTQRASGPAAASTTIDADALRDEIDAGEPHPADLA